MLHAVIMAGGSGTRFWPASRRSLPKQFLALTSARTLLQEAADRCLPWISNDRMWVVAGIDHAVETGRQLPEIRADHILLEPCGRNTAPCIGLAAIHLLAADSDAVMLAMPADHVITPAGAFRSTVESAVRQVERNPQSAVLLGIPPSFPAIGYGYIERGPGTAEDAGVFQVQSFREKPDRATAEEFLNDGNFCWNSGIFVWRAARILELIAEFQPALAERLARLAAALGTPDWDAALAAEFPAMPSISLDFGILEQARELYVVPAAFAWDDVGSWQSLARLRNGDPLGNTIEGPHAGIDTRGTIVRTTPGHLVATIGLEDCIVVHTPDVTLVARRGDEESLRRLVAQLEARGYGKFL